MKNKNLLQKIGFILFIIGVVGRLLSRILGEEVKETLRLVPLIALAGIVLWVIGYFTERSKVKNQPEESNSNSDSN